MPEQEVMSQQSQGNKSVLCASHANSALLFINLPSQLCSRGKECAGLRAFCYMDL